MLVIWLWHTWNGESLHSKGSNIDVFNMQSGEVVTYKNQFAEEQ